jgi:hypothetical protein
MESHPTRKKNVKDVNDDDDLVISSYGVVLEDNEKGKLFYRSLSDIVEGMYRLIIHLQYKNQSSDSKNRVIHTLQESFSEPWSMRPMRLATKKLTITKKNNIKGIITKHVFSIICSNNYQINLFFSIYFHVHLRKNNCVFFFQEDHENSK